MPIRRSENQSSALPPLTFAEHVTCYITLGLLCGCIQLYFVMFPFVAYYIYRGSYLAIGTAVVYAVLAMHPLSHKPWPAFCNSRLIRLWQKYFAFTWEVHPTLEKGKKYFFLEFPHAIFPMGQVLSAEVVKKAFPDDVVCGVAADIIFCFPIFRHVVAWTGTRGASRKNVLKIFDEGSHCTVLPGGIAEIFVCNQDTEDIYFKDRKQIIRMALQEGVNIIPGFFYGNSKIFQRVGSSGGNSWISTLSRRLRASIVLYYGCHFLPVPLRHPLHMVIADIIPVEKAIPDPTDDQVDELHEQVVRRIASMYEEYKPAWEGRNLIIH